MKLMVRSERLTNMRFCLDYASSTGSREDFKYLNDLMALKVGKKNPPAGVVVLVFHIFTSLERFYKCVKGTSPSAVIFKKEGKCRNFISFLSPPLVGVERGSAVGSRD